MDKAFESCIMGHRGASDLIGFLFKEKTLNKLNLTLKYRLKAYDSL